jgi:TolA-binding protein
MSTRGAQLRCLDDEALSATLGPGAALPAHVATCPSCQARRAALARAPALLRQGWAPYEPSDEALAATSARLLADLSGPRARPPPPAAWRAALATAALLLLTTGLGLWWAQRAAGPSATLRAEVLTSSEDARVEHTLSRLEPGTLEDEVVRLRQGRVRLHVAPLSGQQRFRVVVGDGEVEVRGTTFDVQVDADRLQAVAVTEGVVVVRRAAEPAVWLRAGEAWSTAPRPGEAPALVVPTREVIGSTVAAAAARAPLEPQLVVPDDGAAIGAAAPSATPRASTPGGVGGAATTGATPRASTPGVGGAAAMGATPRATTPGVGGAAATGPRPAHAPADAGLAAAASVSGEAAAPGPSSAPAVVRADAGLAARPGPTAARPEPSPSVASPVASAPPVVVDAASAAQLFREGWLLLRQNDRRKAVATFARAEAVAGDDPVAEDAAYWRTMTLVSLRAREAEAALRAYLVRYPSAQRRPTVQIALADHLIATRRRREARTLLEQVVAGPDVARGAEAQRRLDQLPQ